MNTRTASRHDAGSSLPMPRASHRAPAPSR
jgi:hypothetical protein